MRNCLETYLFFSGTRNVQLGTNVLSNSKKTCYLPQRGYMYLSVQQTKSLNRRLRQKPNQQQDTVSMSSS